MTNVQSLNTLPKKEIKRKKDNFGIEAIENAQCMY